MPKIPPASFYDHRGMLFSVFCDCEPEQVHGCTCLYDERYTENPDYSVLPKPRNWNEKNLFDRLALEDGHWIYTPPEDVSEDRAGHGGNVDFIPSKKAQKIVRRGHRSVWRRVGRDFGRIPAGKYLGCAPHCGVFECTRPDHRVIETPTENVGRYDSPAGINARKTACGVCGGPFDYTYPNGDRDCSACRKRRHAESRARKQAEHDALVARVAELEAQLRRVS